MLIVVSREVFMLWVRESWRDLSTDEKAKRLLLFLFTGR